MFSLITSLLLVNIFPSPFGSKSLLTAEDCYRGQNYDFQCYCYWEPSFPSACRCVSLKRPNKAE